MDMCVMCVRCVRWFAVWCCRTCFSSGDGEEREKQQPTKLNTEINSRLVFCKLLLSLFLNFLFPSTFTFPPFPLPSTLRSRDQLITTDQPILTTKTPSPFLTERIEDLPRGRGVGLTCRRLAARSVESTYAIVTHHLHTAHRTKLQATSCDQSVTSHFSLATERHPRRRNCWNVSAEPTGRSIGLHMPSAFAWPLRVPVFTPLVWLFWHRIFQAVLRKTSPDRSRLSPNARL